MTNKVTKRKFVVTVMVLLGVIFILVLVSLLIPLLINELETPHLKTVFAEQSRIFSQPINALGVQGDGTEYYSCTADEITHFKSTYICSNYKDYDNTSSPMPESARNAYPTNAARFDRLLRQNGWVNDRPQDPITSLVASNPYLPDNNGVGGDVPFHKNIGSISCNLEIIINPLADPSNASGAINVNTFSCKQTLSYFWPSLLTHQRTGP